MGGVFLNRLSFAALSLFACALLLAGCVEPESSQMLDCGNDQVCFENQIATSCGPANVSVTQDGVTIYSEVAPAGVECNVLLRLTNVQLSSSISEETRQEIEAQRPLFTGASMTCRIAMSEAELLSSPRFLLSNEMSARCSGLLKEILLQLKERAAAAAVSPTPSPSATPPPSASVTPTATGAPSASASSSVSPIPTASPTVSSTPIPSQSASVTPAASGCSRGTADCDSNSANGCETSTATDVENCGGCGYRCPQGEACFDGACSGQPDPMLTSTGCYEVTDYYTVILGAGLCVHNDCPLHAANCDLNSDNECEADLNMDGNNCGRCGNVCPDGAYCRGGSCVVRAASPSATPTPVSSAAPAPCANGTMRCDSNAANGCETSTTTDVYNCGGCRYRCVTGAACVSGACTPDPEVASGSYSVFSASECRESIDHDAERNGLFCYYDACPPFTANCDLDSYNGCESALYREENCGRCGNACPSGKRCISGNCV